MRFIPNLAFSATSVSSTNVYTSAAIDASSVFAASVQVVSAGSNPNGTVTLQYSNDIVNAGVAQTNWSTVGSATVALTNNGVYKIDKQDISAMFLRLSYTNASGSGTLTAVIKTDGF